MGVCYPDTIERMRWAGKLKNDSAVARVLGVTPQALSNYKKRGELPTDLVIRFSGIYSLSVDWLLTGHGDVYKIGYEPPEGERPLPMLHEDSAYYASGRAPDIAKMTSDEIIYVGKLLKIFRGENKNTSDAIKWSIDAFCKAAVNQAPKPQSVEATEEKMVGNQNQ